VPVVEPVADVALLLRDLEVDDLHARGFAVEAGRNLVDALVPGGIIVRQDDDALAGEGVGEAVFPLAGTLRGCGCREA
jgi:hypothetical protein